MKINAFFKNLLDAALQWRTKPVSSQPTATREQEKVSATTVAGRPPRPDINQGGWPGRNA